VSSYIFLITTWCLSTVGRCIICSARCNIYISRLCHDASLSVRLSVTFVHCGHRVHGSRITLHSLIDGCLYYLLTTPDPNRRMGWCRDFWLKGGYGKSGNCSDIAYFTYFLSMDRNHVTYLFISETELLNIKTCNILSQFIWTISKFFMVISVENALYLKTVRLITTSA